IRDATREAVALMEQGVADVDHQMKQASNASDDNDTLHQTVEELFDVIAVMATNSKEHGRQAGHVAQTTQAMAKVIHTLRYSSDQVEGNAAGLHQLSGTFLGGSEPALPFPLGWLQRNYLRQLFCLNTTTKIPSMKSFEEMY